MAEIRDLDLDDAEKAWDEWVKIIDNPTGEVHITSDPAWEMLADTFSDVLDCAKALRRERAEADKKAEWMRAQIHAKDDELASLRVERDDKQSLLEASEERAARYRAEAEKFIAKMTKAEEERDEMRRQVESPATFCKEERAMGNGGCGACSICCGELRARLAIAQARIKELEEKYEVHRPE